MSFPSGNTGHLRKGPRDVVLVAKRMCATVLLCLALLAFLMPAPVSAQTASFRAVDTNSDGILSVNELVAAFGRAGANRLLQSTDHNGDGRITISELRRGPDEGRDDDQDDDRDDDGDDDGDDDNGDDDGGDDGGDDGDGGDGDGGDGDGDGDGGDND